MTTLEKNPTERSSIDMGVSSTLPQDQMFPTDYLELQSLLGPKKVGLYRRFRSVLVKLKYQLWLVLLRETSILKELIINYEKIPKKTPTYRIVTLFVKFSTMKNLLFVIDKRLRRRLY